MEEIWLPITSWEKIYEVSNLGRIKNRKTGWIKIARANNRGYLLVQLEGGKGNAKQTLLVHRLVATAFVIKGDKSYNVVHHKDENPNNNYASNLHWCTQRDNVHYSINSGKSNPKEALKKGRDNRKVYGKMVIDYDTHIFYDTAMKAFAARLPRPLNKAMVWRIMSGKKWNFGINIQYC